MMTVCAQVRVKFVLSNGAVQNGEFILIPQGGLEGHVRRDTTQAASSGAKTREQVLVLSNMDVSVAQLQLLMEAALAGLQQAAPPTTHNTASSPTVANNGNKSTGSFFLKKSAY